MVIVHRQPATHALLDDFGDDDDGRILTLDSFPSVVPSRRRKQ